jgi:hypothetical protein
MSNIALKFTSASAEEASAAPTFEKIFTSNYDYLIPVAAWNADLSKDIASMMNPLVYGYAYVRVVGNTTVIEVYFISNSVQPPMPQYPPIPIKSSWISALQYTDIGSDEYSYAPWEYDELTDISKATLTLSTGDVNILAHIAAKITYKSSESGNSSTSAVSLKLTLADAEITDAAPTFENAFLSGNSYTVPVKAWHETNDAASMMSPMVEVAPAYAEVGDTETTVTFYIGGATLYGQYASASAVTSLKYKDIGDEEYGDATYFSYDAEKDIITVKIVISDIKAGLIPIEMVNGGRTQYIRLNFNLDGAALAE